MKKNIPRPILLLVFLSVALAGAWWRLHRPAVDGAVTLYGNVDFRQASVPFNGAERIAEVLVEEGHLVHQGQLLAKMDTRRLQPQLRQIESAVAAQRAVVERFQNGSRKEEIAEARANLAAAKADAENADILYQRRKALSSKSYVSKSDLDAARSTADAANAKAEAAKNALELLVLGPRVEDIAQAQAQLNGYEAQLALIRQQLADAELRAPFDAIVQSRLMEPGEMAAPSKPVFSLAMLAPKWIRAYVPEPDLGRVRPGQHAAITIDSLRDRPIEGWVGFISPVAEFTPKTVQTEDLRASLVFEVRIFVKDPENVLRLGMPATVKMLTEGGETNEVSPMP